MTTTLVVPCHNEADRLDPVAITGLLDVADALVLVDDGSTDQTGSLLAEIAAQAGGRAATIGLPHNVGKGEAVRAGLRRAIDDGADVVGYLDADLATPPTEVPRLRAALVDNVDVVLGSRVQLLGHAIARRPLRHYLGRVYATLASAALELDVYDTQCGAKLFRVNPSLRAALDVPFDERWSFDVELIARLVVPDDPRLALPPERLVEVPLLEWRDVGESRLSLTAGIRATIALVGVGRRLRSRRVNAAQHPSE